MSVLPCPSCGHPNTSVLDSRPLSNLVLDAPSIRRRRICENCMERFTTFELRESDLLSLGKSARGPDPDLVESIESIRRILDTISEAGRGGSTSESDRTPDHHKTGETTSPPPPHESERQRDQLIDQYASMMGEESAAPSLDTDPARARPHRIQAERPAAMLVRPGSPRASAGASPRRQRSRAGASTASHTRSAARSAARAAAR